MNLQRTSRVVGHHRPVRRDQGADDQDLLLAVRPLRAGDAFLPDSPPDLSHGRCRGLLAASTEWAQTTVYGFSLYIWIHIYIRQCLAGFWHLIWSFFYWFIAHYFLSWILYEFTCSFERNISEKKWSEFTFKVKSPTLDHDMNSSLSVDLQDPSQWCSSPPRCSPSLSPGPSPRRDLSDISLVFQLKILHCQENSCKVSLQL